MRTAPAADIAVQAPQRGRVGQNSFPDLSHSIHIAAVSAMGQESEEYITIL